MRIYVYSNGIKENMVTLNTNFMIVVTPENWEGGILERNKQLVTHTQLFISLPCIL